MTEETNPLRQRVRIVQIYIGICLLLIGTIGNLLAFIVLRQKALRIHATAFLLSVLAICDMGCLYLGLLNKVVEYFVGDDVFRSKVSILCSIQVFLLYCSLQYASWLVVLVAAERFFSVWFPLKSRSLCTVRNAKIASLVVFLVLAAINSQFLFTTAVIWQSHEEADPERIHQINKPLQPGFDSSNSSVFVAVDSFNFNATAAQPQAEPLNATMISGSYVCDAKPEFDYLLNSIWPYIDLTIFCFIPFFIMLILNFLIAWRILSIRRNSSLYGSSGRSLSGMTAIMFACCFSFFALTLPISVYMIARSKIATNEPKNQDMMYAIWAVVNLLQYTSNAINFFLYCLSGTLFRRELMRLFRAWHWHLKALFCCWYCYPERMPNAFTDYAEADIAGRFKKPADGGDRLKLVGPTPSQKSAITSKSDKLFACCFKRKSKGQHDDEITKLAHADKQLVSLPKKRPGSVYTPVVIGGSDEDQPFILRHTAGVNHTASTDNKLTENSENIVMVETEESSSNNAHAIANAPSVRSSRKKSSISRLWKRASSAGNKQKQHQYSNKTKHKIVMATFFDSEATSGGAFASAKMQAIKEESFVDDNEKETGASELVEPQQTARRLSVLESVPENRLSPNADRSSPNDEAGAAEEEAFSYQPVARNPPSRQHQHAFQAFGPMC